MSHGCSNCGAVETDSYELTPDTPTTRVNLCEKCHASLEAEFVWAG